MAECGIDIDDLRNELLIGGIKQAIDTGEENHPLGSDQFRNLDGEHVVVSEAEFADSDRVVLVDDRKDAWLLEEAIEGVEEIRGSVLGLDVLSGEENLRDKNVKIGKQRAVGAHQAGLPDGSAGLAGCDIVGIFGKSHRGNTGADCAGRNKQTAMSRIDEFRDGRDQMNKGCSVDGAVGSFGQDTCAGFDNGEIAGHEYMNFEEEP